MVRDIESLSIRASRELAQRSPGEVERENALVLQVADRQPARIGTDRDAENKAAGVRDLLDALTVGADVVDLPGFSAGIDAAVGMHREALRMIQAFAEDRCFF